MLHPEPLGPDAPLHSNQRILKKAGVPVPGILGWDGGLGAVLVEDFGDTTLQRHLAGCAPAPGAARRLYREACSIIIDMQKRGGPAVRPGDFAARNALDRERFLFELDHFHRHYIARLRRMRPEKDDEGLLRAFYDDLAGRCDRLGRVYCHRDFQSRNLMVRGRGAGLRLGVVDFQDARMGPYPYDAASLLRDSSLDLPPALVEEMLQLLIEGLDLDPEEFRRDFDLMALQRNLKDLGTFGYLATVRGRREYLDYVPRTLGFIRGTLLRYREHHVIFPVLERFVLSPV
jgi:hypothetical protein